MGGGGGLAQGLGIRLFGQGGGGRLFWLRDIGMSPQHNSMGTPLVTAKGAYDSVTKERFTLTFAALETCNTQGEGLHQHLQPTMGRLHWGSGVLMGEGGPCKGGRDCGQGPSNPIAKIPGKLWKIAGKYRKFAGKLSCCTQPSFKLDRWLTFSFCIIQLGPMASQLQEPDLNITMEWRLKRRRQMLSSTPQIDRHTVQHDPVAQEGTIPLF